MSVYVDFPTNHKRFLKGKKFEYIRLCRMIADTPGELYVIARELELQRKSFIHGLTSKTSIYGVECFTLSEFNRIKAIELGAVEIDNHDLDVKIQQLKNYRKMEENTKNALGCKS
jgi:hypothetical protein